MALKRRKNIERATSIMVQYAVLEPEVDVKERLFNNYKSARQWIIDRNDGTLDFMVMRMLVLIDDEWEPFTTIGKKTITLSELETIVRDLREGYKPSKKEN